MIFESWFEIGKFGSSGRPGSGSGLRFWAQILFDRHSLVAKFTPELPVHTVEIWTFFIKIDTI